MITLFEGYLAGLIAGMLGSMKNTRYWALSFFYAVVIISAHFKLNADPQFLGSNYYIGAGAAQLIIMGASLIFWSAPSMLISLLAYIAVIVNGFLFANYPSHGGIFVYQFALINTIQTLQIVSLIVLSPASVYLLRPLIARITIPKGITWLSRSQT